jgi:CelD/BcsL family acetyltransferase involved in cellulose biosynthesis
VNKAKKESGAEIVNVVVKRPQELSPGEVTAWHDFQSADPALCSPYFSIEFALACDRVRQDTRVAIVQKNDAPTGFLPFHRGPLGYCLPLGAALSDFQGMIAQKGVSIDLVALMRKAGIGLYPFDYIPATQHAFNNCFEGEAACHSADLSKGFAHWYDGRFIEHKKYHKRYEANARKLEKNHGEIVFTMDDRNEDAFDTLLAWKSAQYHATGVFDVFSVPWTRALLQQLWHTKSNHFAGQLSTLRVDGKMVAAHFGMRADHAAHYWFPAYDPAFSSFGVGHILLLKLIQNHADAGVRAVHLGVGDYRYKHQFGGATVMVCDGTAFSPSLVGFCRQGAALVQHAFEALPLGPVSRLPGRVLHRLDRTMAFRAS